MTSWVHKIPQKPIVTVQGAESGLEMIYRGLYHFYVAYQQGKATDPISYCTAPENQDLGIVKRQRKPNVKLIVASFTDRQRNTDQFCFSVYTEIPLTTAMQP
jgi:hypothetical protein